MPYKAYIYLVIHFFEASISLSKKAWYFVYAVHAALKIPLFLNIYLV